jgi:ATP-dependent Clp endopeptidase proteolytic subunit ClpP
MLVKHNIDSTVILHDIEELVLKPIIVRVNKFSEGASKQFAVDVSDAHNTGQKIIPIVIDSGGGCVYTLLSMIDMISRAKLPIATIVEGKAMSCGAVLASCGTAGHRYIGPKATMMIHDVSSDVWGKTEDVKADAKESERLNQLLYSVLDENADKESGYFWNLVKENNRADLYLSAEQVVEHSLADTVGIPTLTTTISVKQKLSI